MPRPLGAPTTFTRTEGPRDSNRWTVMYTEEGLIVVITIGEVFGRPEIVGLEVKPFDGPPELELAFPQYVPTPITAELLRRLPLAKLKAACLADLAGANWRSFREAAGDTPKRGQSPIPIERLERAARVYVAAILQFENPIQRIETEMGIKPATARKYVSRARRVGILPYPERPGVAGVSSATSPITGRSSGAAQKEDQS